jgi:hypothetical protein
MQSSEIVVVEEKRSVLIEGDCAAGGIVEDMDALWGEVEEGGEIEEEVGECFYAWAFRYDECVMGGYFVGEEDFDAV